MDEVEDVRTELAAVKIVLSEIVKVLCNRTPDPTAALAEFGAGLEGHVEQLDALWLDAAGAARDRYFSMSAKVHEIKEMLLDLGR